MSMSFLLIEAGLSTCQSAIGESKSQKNYIEDLKGMLDYVYLCIKVK